MLITASTVQHAETVLVGIAPRYHDASATRNIPHVNLCQTTDLGGCPRDSSSGKSVFQIVYFQFLSFAFHASVAVGHGMLRILPFTGRTCRRDTVGRSSLKFVSSSSADPALVGNWRLCQNRAKTTWNICFALPTFRIWLTLSRQREWYFATRVALMATAHRK